MLSAARVKRRADTLADQVYDLLCASIVAGELRPGERLIVEQLALKLGVSLTPVREAVIRLAKDRLAVEGPDGRLLVVPLTPRYVNEIFLVRGALEGLAAELATPNMTAADLAELGGLLEEGDRGLAGGAVDVYSRTSGPLHQRIIMRAGSQALSHELQALGTHVAYILGYSKRQMGAHLLRSQAEHWDMLRALASGDALAARQVVEAHVRASGQRIAALIEYDRATSGTPQ